MQSGKENPPTKHTHSFARLALRCAVALAITISIAIPSTHAIAEAEESASFFPDDEAPRHFYATVGLGLDFSRGDYGEPGMTNSLAIPFSLKLEYEPITMRISLPYSVIDGSESVFNGSNGRDNGDLTTSLTYTYYPSSALVPVVDLTTKIKFPTANNQLGTGKTDVTLQIELSKSLGDLSGFGSFGYRFKGGFYDDIVVASVGAGYRLTRASSMGVAYDYREASVFGAGDSHEISPYLSIRSGEHLRFGPYGIVGLSPSAADWGLGANISWNY
jgi:hypothetical protein